MTIWENDFGKSDVIKLVEKRAILLILDSLGVGAMDDVLDVRPQDAKANTFYHILDQAQQIQIPWFEYLGINRLLQHPRLNHNDGVASVGVLNLQHDGADSYAGHQEMMGTRPRKPVLQPFAEQIDVVQQALIEAGYQAKIPNPELPYLWVNDAVVVADNIETDYGQIYNVSAALDAIPYEEVLTIGKIVRQVVQVNRVIALGGENVAPEQLRQCIERRSDGLIGVNSPRSGVYEKGYQARHLGFGVDPNKQIPTILSKNGFDVHLIGKMQDVIDCEQAFKSPAIDTEMVMKSILSAMQKMEKGLIAATVQETDLAGHAENVNRYAQKIMQVDDYLALILRMMNEEDLLIISADHGNDPTIGHSQHTREKTFVLAYQKNLRPIDLGERSTLSDIAATIAQFFQVSPPENGTGFYDHMLEQMT